MNYCAVKPQEACEMGPLFSMRRGRFRPQRNRVRSEPKHGAAKSSVAPQSLDAKLAFHP